MCILKVMEHVYLTAKTQSSRKDTKECAEVLSENTNVHSST